MREILILTALNLRLRRGFLLGWLLPIIALIGIFPYAYYQYYPTLADRQDVIIGFEHNVGTRAIYGLIDTPGTVGQMTTWEAAMWAGVLGAIMISLLVVDIHRRREYTGIGELQRAAGIRASTPWAAAVLTGLVVSVFLGVASTITLLLLPLSREEIPSTGAVAFGVTLTLILLGSMLLAQVAVLFLNDGAQLSKAALLSVAASYVVRIVADTQDISWLNWFSPLGWRELIGPFTEDDFGVAAYLALLCLGVTGLLWLAESRREYGAGLVRWKSTTRKARAVHGLVHLRWLLARSGIVVWLLVVFGSSAFLMSLSGDIADFVAGPGASGQVFRELLGGTAAYEAFIAYISQMIAIMIAAAGIAQITAVATEEKARTIDLQRAAGVRRWAPLGAAALVGLLSLLALVAALHGGGAVGLASQESTEPSDYTAMATSAWSLLGAVVLFLGGAMLIVGWLPRAAGWAWAPLAASALVTLMGEILQLPDWLIDLSPLSYALLPDDPDTWIPITLGISGVLLILLGLVGAARREVR